MPWKGTSGLGYMPVVHGFLAPGWDRVKDAFAENFKIRNEVGAAVCIYYKGEKVVDIWGGESHDSGAEWQEDTIACIFSGSKGLAALVLLMLKSSGHLDYDAPVAQYWPEFGENDKKSITVRQLLAHQAGLAPIDRDMTVKDLADWQTVGAAIAATRPAWETGTQHGYMGVTLGWYIDQLVRRCDPKQRSVSQFIAEDVAPVLGLAKDFYLGLPPEEELPRSRVVDFNFLSPFELLRYGLMQKRANMDCLKAYLLRPSSYTYRAFKNPKLTGDASNYNKEEVRQLEIPAANVHASARFVASFYNAFVQAANGQESPLNFSADAIAEVSQTPPPEGFDETLRINTRFSHGFQRPNSGFVFGSDDTAIGHGGTGGSMGMADATAGIAYSYVMRMGNMWGTDPREVALRQAMYDVVADLGGPSRPQPHEPRLQDWLKRPDDLYFRSTLGQRMASRLLPERGRACFARRSESNVVDS
jgi:CubicO group peptidase (beta-lactamase class C family)